MNQDHFKSLINLFESRDPSLDYEDTSDNSKVIAKLKSHKSREYTQLAQKLERIDELETEVKYLKQAVKEEAREHIHDLFDAEDAARTRVVETISFIFVLTKDPKPTESYKYAEIIKSLESQLTPELIKVLESLKKQFKTVTQKSPALSVNPVIKEGVHGLEQFNRRYKNTIYHWAHDYDKKLNRLKLLASRL